MTYYKHGSKIWMRLRGFTKIFLPLAVATSHHLSFLGVEEPCFCRVIGKTKEYNDCYQCAEASFNDIHPSIQLSHSP